MSTSINAIKPYVHVLSVGRFDVVQAGYDFSLCVRYRSALGDAPQSDFGAAGHQRLKAEGVDRSERTGGHVRV